MSALIELFRASTPLYGGNAAFVEDLDLRQNDLPIRIGSGEVIRAELLIDRGGGQ